MVGVVEMKTTKKQRDYFKKFYKENKNYFKQYMKEYYNKHKDEMKINSRMSHQKKYVKQNYNRPLKNKVRDKLISFFDNKNINKILTLESPDFLFCKELPNKKFYVYEIDFDIYNKMKKTKPNNVSIFNGDVSEFKDLEINVDGIYLDFCASFQTQKETIYLLKEVIKNCNVFAVTFCSRQGIAYEEYIGDYKIDLIRKIQELTEVNWKVLFGESYKDEGHGTMITLVFEK